MKSVLFVASEGLPFIKSGGLADVIGSLPNALVKKGYDVRVVLPLYLKMANKNRKDFTKVSEYSVQMYYREVPVTLYMQMVGNVTFYFIENQFYFERENLYGYDDDGERFAYYQKAVLEMLNQIDYFPDIMHAHDWHTGMLSCMCKTNYASDTRYANIKHVYTIHNLAYQGNFGREILHPCLGLEERLFEDGSVRFDNGISYMKTGLVFADKVTTVSPTYSHEILTPEYGERLERVLQMRYKDLSGITNGIDIEMWNPSKDELIYEKYNKVNVFKRKSLNKLALQKEMGLKEDRDVFLLGVVTRLTSQKGIDMILDKLSSLLKANVQLVVLGSGDTAMENAFKEANEHYKGQFAFYCGYNEALSHKVYAACDGFLMPSRFEPCGISQLISLRYGTLPIVRETGGLKDTVMPYNEYTKEGNGFSFTNYNSAEMLNTIFYALKVYYETVKDFRTLVKAAMNSDVSWDKSAEEYFDLYENL